MSDVRQIERVPSGVPGLDTILQGGFPKGGIHILQGAPGVGKTTLGNQICYHHVAKGGRALYVTLLSETHARMLLHLGTMTFFDADRLPDQIAYISGLGVLQSEGLPGLVTLLRREIAARKASVLMLDGLVAAEDRAASDTEFKTFIQELQAQAGLHGCTVFLLTTAKGQALPPEHTMVDGIVELTDVRFGSRTERGLFVNKLRGSDYLSGRHPFRITEEGLVVYPRTEAAFRITTQPDRTWSGRLSTGVEGLDAMFGGGFPEGTVTGVLGPSGIGKTTLGLHFVCGSSAAEPGLFFGFYETPARLQQQARTLGLDLAGAVDRGDVDILWQPQGENIEDALAHRLLDAIAERGVKRLFLDGLGGFIESSVEPGRLSRFLAVLVNELRSRGVTALYTMETRDVVGPGIELPVTGVSSLVENLVALRYVEHHRRSRRLVSVVKVRGSSFDPGLREFVIESGRGLSIAGAFEGAEELLSGFARDRPAADVLPSGPEGQ
ncbi:AAA family ATPase [Siccirubricoccus sp. KC 17139]|uniref:non-specific serine/threonine protein kinase n=1 Tax=Siccirubricoccus soli TaxID=2899147 RepID=A0ABT1DBX8_9PROT|nr:ATPase domain-containing protein [Siccirubricoccus soli]MCO6419087.1 AAA family ATPase [Siccirubricoccus soli]MCP2685222.1 AAA family ATPase [Siccirubricoccus soli]